MGRAVTRIRGNNRCLRQCRCDCACQFNDSLKSGLEANTCYWYQSQLWGWTRKLL